MCFRMDDGNIAGNFTLLVRPAIANAILGLHNHIEVQTSMGCCIFTVALEYVEDRQE